MVTTDIGARVLLDPKGAKGELRELLRAHSGSTEKVAKHLGVTRRTVDRWVTKLKLGELRPGRGYRKAAR
jgi:excisionase family DNA binding protein